MKTKRKKHLSKNEWNPYTSKWKAAMEIGMDVGLNGDENILYLGASSGTTISHLSKNTSGIIFGVEKSPHMMIKLIRLAELRNNISPIFSDARDSEFVKERLFGRKIDILFQDIPSRDQVKILKESSLLVGKDCKIFLSLKTQSISQRNWMETVRLVEKDLKKNFKIVDMKPIEKFHQKHFFFVLEKI